MLGAMGGAVIGSGEPLGWILGGVVGALSGRVVLLSQSLKELTQRLGEVERKQRVAAVERATSAARAQVATTAGEGSEAAPISVSNPKAESAAAASGQIWRTADDSPQAARVGEPGGASSGPTAVSVEATPAASAATPPPGPSPDPSPASGPAPGRAKGERVWRPEVSREPDIFDRGLRWLKAWFTEGNVPVKIGVLVSFVGLAALLKFAAQNALLKLPVEFWLSAVAAAAIAALWFAWGQREQRRLFSLGLQGGALGVLLMTVFAAFRFYELLPVMAAFAFALLVVAASVVLAVKQDAKALAVLGFTGGFLAPVLISTGSGNHVALFSYFALLNSAVFAIAWWRSWRLLNLVGFVFTFAIGTLWGVLSYKPENLASTEPFLVLFFLMYVGIAHLFALRQDREREPMIDGTLLYGTPLIAASLQAALLQDRPMSMALAALCASAVYAVLGYSIRQREPLATLRMVYASLAVGFATAAVPLALDANVTAQIWALEGAAVLWLGLRQNRLWPQFAGSLLQWVAALAWLYSAFEYVPAETPALRNGVFVGGWVVSLAWGCSAYLLQRMDGARLASRLFLLGSVLIWLGTGGHEIEHFVSAQNSEAAWLGWWLVGWLLALAVLRWLDWADAGWLAVGCAVMGLIWSLIRLDGNGLSGTLLWLWPLFLLVTLASLRWLRALGHARLAIAHLSLLAALCIVLGTELHSRLSALPALGSDWSVLAGWLPLALLLLGGVLRPNWVGRPVAELFVEYRLPGLALGGLALSLFWLFSLGAPGAPSPLPFVPLINPLELAQLGLLAMALLLLTRLGWSRTQLLPVIALLTWLWLSVATLRAVHHLADVAWNHELWRSMLAQTSLTVVWSLTGVAAWVWGSRSGARRIWQAGAVIMAVVLLKLGLIDRQHMSNIAGIVSFLAVGGLLTLVGYLAPSPPAQPASDADSNESAGDPAAVGAADRAADQPSGSA